MAIVVCVLPAWSAGPAQASEPLPGGVQPAATAVEQATAPAVTTTEPPALRSTAPSPRRSAARARRARAASAAVVHHATPAPVRSTTGHVATAVETSPQPAASTTAPQRGSEGATATVRNASKPAAATVRNASKPAAATIRNASKPATATARTASKPGAATIRTASKPGAATIRTASNRAAATVSNASDRDVSNRAAAAVREGSKLVDTVGQAARAIPARLAAVVAAANTLSKLGAVASVDATLAGPAGSDRPSSTATPTGGVAAYGGARPVTAAHQPVVAIAARPTPAASGWRNAAAAPADRVSGARAGLSESTNQSGSAAFTAASVGAPASTALLGLLGLLIFVSQRPGTLIRLRPTWAPAAPFLALSERPG